MNLRKWTIKEIREISTESIKEEYPFTLDEVKALEAITRDILLAEQSLTQKSKERE